MRATMKVTIVRLSHERGARPLRPRREHPAVALRHEIPATNHTLYYPPPYFTACADEGLSRGVKRIFVFVTCVSPCFSK